MADSEGSALKRARTSREAHVPGASESTGARAHGPGVQQRQVSVGKKETEDSGAVLRGGSEEDTEAHQLALGADEGIEEALLPIAGILEEPHDWAAETNAAARALLLKAQTDPVNIRQFLRGQAAELAEPCTHASPLPHWDPKRPNEHTTCGVQQADLVAGVNMEQAFERQKECAAAGDDVPYVLARTLRSNIQYNAAIALKAKGSGNQCRRGACMERAMSMFCGKKAEGIPREVVLALARY